MGALTELLALYEREKKEEQNRLYSLLNEIKQEVKALREQLGLRNNQSHHSMKKYLSLGEVSEIYGIALSTLRRWASLRKFPLYKMGGRVKVSPIEFEEWFKQFRVDFSKLYKRGGKTSE